MYKSPTEGDGASVEVGAPVCVRVPRIAKPVPSSPFGKVNSKVLALGVPPRVTPAVVPATAVAEVIVAGVPGSPLGIVKSSTAAEDVPVLTTEALVPGSPVVVVGLTSTVPAGPRGPGVELALSTNSSVLKLWAVLLRLSSEAVSVAPF